MPFISKIANKLLYTPFAESAQVSDEIRSKLTPKEFFDKCYCEPNFTINVIDEEDNISEENQVDVSDMLNKKYEQERNYQQFFNWLNGTPTELLYVFSGHAGTGKTTFINYLKYKNEFFNWIVLDISKSSAQIRWISEKTTAIDRKVFAMAHIKVLSSILIEIRKILFNYKKREYDHYIPNMKEIVKNAKSIVKVYKEIYLNAYPPGASFMDGIIAIITKFSLHKSNKNIALELEKYCKEYFVVDNEGILDNSSVSRALDVLLLLIKCKSNNKQKYIVVLDNVEKFVLKDEIYNKDIVEIRNFLIEYSNNLENTIYNGKIKFILSVRNTTLAMYEPAVQGGDALENTVDFSYWYNVNEIIAKKLEWYNNNGFETDKESEFVEQIVGDLRQCSDKKLTGLKLFIDPLFNNNTRLIMDFIGMIVENPENYTIIKKYKDFWEEDTSIARFAARSLIRGLILKQLKKSDNLFMHLKTYTDKEDDSGLGISRKILTILHNNAHDARMHLSDVLKELMAGAEVVDFTQTEEYINNKGTISEVLFYMNSCNRKDNDWIQFIDLQIEHSEESVNVEDSSELEELLSEKLQDFSLSIMPAGEIYLRDIVASFEFFSIRYSKKDKYVPLFALVPTVKEMKKCNNIEILPCIKTIKLVAQKTSRCIHKMEKVYQMKIAFDGGSAKTHSERIKNKHLDYINLFIDYLNIKYISSVKVDDKIKEKYSNLVNLLEDIKRTYPEITI